MANEQLTAEQIAEIQRQQAMQNINFFKYTYEQTIKANQQNGTDFSQGDTKNFLVPVLSGSYLTGVTVKVKLKVKPTKGTGTVTLNAAKEYAAIKNIRVNMGADLINISGYFAKRLAEISGYQKTLVGEVFGAGFKSAAVQDMVYKAPTLVDGQDNLWEYEIFVPLNQIHPQSPSGILPMFSNGQPITVSVTPTTNFVGKDPYDSVVSTTGDATVEHSGSIEVLCTYRDYNSFSSRNSYAPNLAGVPTLQVLKLNDINNLTGNNSYQYMKFQNPYRFVRVLSLVVDGFNSDKFVTGNDNITGIRLDRQENTSSPFWYHDETNGGAGVFFAKHREIYGQDAAEDGNLVIHDAPSMNQSDASNRLGENWLDLTQNGFPVARLGVKVNETSTANGINPRVISYGVVLNSGIQMG